MIRLVALTGVACMTPADLPIHACPEGASPQVEDDDGEHALIACRTPEGVFHGLRRRSAGTAPLWEEHWNHGVRQGIARRWIQRVLVAEESFHDGNRHGSFRAWYPDAPTRLMVSGEFLNGLPDGRWSAYGPNGSVAATATWAAGEPAGQRWTTPARWQQDVIIAEQLSVNARLVTGFPPPTQVPASILFGLQPGPSFGWSSPAVCENPAVDRLEWVFGDNGGWVAARACAGEACGPWAVPLVIMQAGLTVPLAPCGDHLEAR